jgi:dTDP-4-dehydrorhamnose 3,5-epimerase
MLHGVRLTPLKQIAVPGGKVMHMLRSDSPHFEKFGEIYFSFVEPRAIKGWSRHRSMTLNYAIPVGQIKLVLFDGRTDSPTHGKIQEILTGADSNYALVTIPPGIWYSFQGLAAESSMIANCATLPHNGDEIEKLDLKTKSIPYSWTP